MTTVLVVRGHQANPWELRTWTRLPDRFDVTVLTGASDRYDTATLGLPRRPVRSRRDRLPPGGFGDLVASAVGDRYHRLDAALAGVDVVHAAELGYWFTGEAARRKAQHGYRLVVTAWETIPLMSAYRSRLPRRYRGDVLAATDLFLAATTRARDALLLEGVPGDRVVVCPPGIDADRFGAAARPPAEPGADHVLLSVGRLVWEKGHQDLLRALAALRRGLVPLPPGVAVPRVVLVGSGPERARLLEHARELGVADRVEITSVEYDDMPALMAAASCLVLASEPLSTGQVHPLDIPRAFWEEQFGMVLAEAMASGLDVVAAGTGAIPEVLDGYGTLVGPGDWRQLAQALAAGPLARPPGARVAIPADLVARYSVGRAAARLAAAYDHVLAP